MAAKPIVIAMIAPRLFDSVTMIGTSASTRPSPSRPWQAQGRERSVNKDDAELDDRQGCQARVPDPLPPGMQLHPRGAATAEALILIGACPSVDAVAV
jgi:hypothetical protein